MPGMNRRKPSIFKRLLSLVAWGPALFPMADATAAETWVATKTQSELIAAPMQVLSTSTGEPIYRLNNAQGEQVAGVRPLEESQALHIVLSLKSRHAEELDRLASQAGVQRKPLTPSEFKGRYAPSDAQVQAVIAYLKKNGFANIVVASNNRLISADGHASNVQTAFRAEMKRFVYQGREVYANASAAQVPVSLGEIIESVLGLQSVFVPRVAGRPNMHIMQPSSAAPSSEH